MNSRRLKGNKNHDELAPTPDRAKHCKLHHFSCSGGHLSAAKIKSTFMLPIQTIMKRSDLVFRALHRQSMSWVTRFFGELRLFRGSDSLRKAKCTGRSARSRFNTFRRSTATIEVLPENSRTSRWSSGQPHPPTACGAGLLVEFYRRA
jgi:hypothetical protein